MQNFLKGKVETKEQFTRRTTKRGTASYYNNLSSIFSAFLNR